MKKGFGILYSIIIMVLVATISVYILSFTAQNATVESNEKIKLQMQLYLNSTIEYALLWLSENKNNINKDINISYDKEYKFQVHFTPIYGVIKNIESNESNGSAIIDVQGIYIGGDKILRIAKRTIQKP